MPIKLQGTNSAAAPGLTNDGGDGIVVGTDSVDISTGGTSRLKVDSSGRVDLGGSTNSSTGIGVLRTKHHTTSNNPVNMIGCVSGSGYNNVQIGGNDTSFTGTAATNVRFYTGANATTANGTLRGYWDGSGNLGISDGNLVIGTAGHGIDFSVTADGTTMGSELLDDYEEGTFQPSWSSSGVGLTFSYSANHRHGYYTKIGNLVNFNLYVSSTAAPSGDATNPLSISGLPYSSSNATGNSTALTIGFYYNMTAGTDEVFPLAYINQNTSSVTLLWSRRNSQVSQHMISSDLTDYTYLIINGSYRV